MNVEVISTTDLKWIAKLKNVSGSPATSIPEALRNLAYSLEVYANSKLLEVLR